MALVVKAKKNDSANDLIKKFKKLVAIANIIDIAKDRQFHLKPALKRNIQHNEIKRQKRRAARIAKRLKGTK